MPFIVRWPGTVGAGAVSDQTISFTDVLATMADVAAARAENRPAVRLFVSAVEAIGTGGWHHPVARLTGAAADFEDKVTRRATSAGYTVAHPVFGSLDPGDCLRLQALHTAHHTRQLPGASGVQRTPARPSGAR